MGCLRSSDISLTHAVSHRCFELQMGNDKDRPYQSDPEALVWQAKEATKKVSLSLFGMDKSFQPVMLSGCTDYDLCRCSLHQILVIILT